MSCTGVVTAWDPLKGLGFVTGEDAAFPCWVHRSDLLDTDRLVVGAKVTYEVVGEGNAVEVHQEAAPVEAKRRTGVVKKWLGSASLGVVECDDLTLVKVTNESFDGSRLEGGYPVSFEVIEDDDDQPLAINMEGEAIVPLGLHAGTVVQWDKDRAFGFIQPDDMPLREAQLWCHVTDLSQPGGCLIERERVYYDVMDRGGGKWKAVNVSGPGLRGPEIAPIGPAKDAWRGLVLPTRQIVPPTARLFVHNIPPYIQWQEVKDEFVLHARCEGVGYVGIHEDNRGPYALVEFFTLEEAQRAMSVFKTREFRDRKLQIVLDIMEGKGRGRGRGGR
eukprot:TRINITY_DN20845_c0_g1_i1.p1 TRINITY_DN20845_c0_g1~~TRINITY_DN20845_c0_g1_i1.p1  ORF type:complete len:332 (+),score=99.84 TRINITY_DN20845_c0_g1_i1:81-1076(+)